MSARSPQVLVAASAETAARIAPLLRSAGFEPLLAPLIATEPLPLDSASSRSLADAGSADWIVLTSKATVAALGDRLPNGTRRLAVVGRRTAAALTAVGLRADLVGEGGGVALADAIIAAGARPSVGAGEIAGASSGGIEGSRVVVIGSAQSHHDIDRRLRDAGIMVERIAVYRTVGVEPPAEVVAAIGAGQLAAVVLTSGTVAEQLLGRFGAELEPIPLVTLGAQTTADARRIGLRVDRQPVHPTLPDLVAAVRELLTAPDDGRPPQEK